MADGQPSFFLLAPRSARWLGLGGAALLIAAWFLPAMHKLGGGYFWSLDYLNEVQSAHKASFFYAQLVAVPVVVLVIQPSAAVRWGALAVAGGLGMWLCLPEFGPMGGLPRHVATLGNLGIVVAAAATLIVAATRRPGVARWVAWGGAALALAAMVLPSRHADQIFSLELASLARRRDFERGEPVQTIVAAFDENAACAMLGLAALAAPIVAGVGAYAAGLAAERPRFTERAALALVLYLPVVTVFYFAATLFPASNYAWDLGVRARYVLTASTFWIWLVTGIAGSELTLHRRET